MPDPVSAANLTVTHQFLGSVCAGIGITDIRVNYPKTVVNGQFVASTLGVAGVNDNTAGTVTWSNLTWNTGSSAQPQVGWRATALHSYSSASYTVQIRIAGVWHEVKNTSPDFNGTGTIYRTKTVTPPAVPLAPAPTGITVDQANDPTESETTTCNIRIPAGQYDNTYGNEVYINGVFDQSVTNNNFDDGSGGRFHVIPCTGGVAFTTEVANLNSLNQAGAKSDPITFTPVAYAAPPPTGGTGGGSLTQLSERDYHLISLGLASTVGLFTIKQFRWRSYD